MAATATHGPWLRNATYAPPNCYVTRRLTATTAALWGLSLKSKRQMTRELLSFICHLDCDMPNGQARRQWVSSFSERCDMCQGNELAPASCRKLASCPVSGIATKGLILSSNTQRLGKSPKAHPRQQSFSRQLGSNEPGLNLTPNSPCGLKQLLNLSTPLLPGL